MKTTNIFIEHMKDKKYIKKLNKKYGLLSVESLDTDTDNGVDYICVSADNVEDAFSQMTMSDKLYSILEKLDKEEKEMIDLYFYKNIPQSEIAEKFGISQQAVSKRIRKICAKIKKQAEILNFRL